MGSALPSPNCCATSCDDVVSVQIPGPAGADGAPGAAGAAGVSGVNAYTTLGAAFTMPAEGANSASTLVGQSTSFVVGQIVFMLGAGWLQVISKADATHMVLKNLKNTATGVYATNVVAGTVIVNGSAISPAGLQGIQGIQGIAGNVGANGAAGSNGSAGTNGKNAFTTTTSNFTQPAVGANVSIAVADSSWAAVNQTIFAGGGGGYYTVISKASALEMTIQNLGYDGNAAPAATVLSGSAISPGGLRGQIVQCVLSSTNTASHNTGILPFDDSIPQIGEGDEILTVAITPTNVNSKLLIEALVPFSNGTTANMSAALFVDATANAIAAIFQLQAAATYPNQISICHELVATTLTARTYRLRMGRSAAGGYGICGTDDNSAVTRVFGGVMRAWLRVTEFAP